MDRRYEKLDFVAGRGEMEKLERAFMREMVGNVNDGLAELNVALVRLYSVGLCCKNEG